MTISSVDSTAKDDQYDQAISLHYAAYRPPLHERILTEQSQVNGIFSLGLDIGCGTGVSTQALKRFCERVYAVDPSRDMIEQALPSEGIDYAIGDGESIALADGVVSVVTFAGSLNYAKSAALVAELQRVCEANAQVWVFDFEVLLDEWLAALGIQLAARPSSYDHAINFSDHVELQPVSIQQQPVTLSMSSVQLAHVLFSSTRRYQALQPRFARDGADVSAFDAVVATLEQLRHERGAREHAVVAQTYFASYQINTYRGQ